MASSAPFVFGTFLLYEAFDAYSLVSVEVQNYLEIIGKYGRHVTDPI